MKQKIHQEINPLELIGRQTLLLGMEAQIQRTMQDANELRACLGLDTHRTIPETLYNELLSRSDSPGNGHQTSHLRNGHQTSHLRNGHQPKEPVLLLGATATPDSPRKRPQMRAMWYQRTTIIRAAGIKIPPGFPSEVLYDRACRKLEKSGKSVESILKKAGIATDDAAEKSSLAVKAKATVTTTPAAKTKPRKVISEHTKSLVGASSARRWALVKAAGIHCTKLPDNKTVARAERILAKRASNGAPVPPVISTPELAAAV